MKKLSNILLLNFAILLAYNVIIHFICAEALYSIMLALAVAVGVHTLILLAQASAHKHNDEKEIAKYYLLAAILILVVGFSACIGASNF